MSHPVVSVVVPVYGCSDCLVALQARIRAALEPLVDSFEVIYVDDRSPDESWTTLRELAEQDESVRAVRLTRNFGQHAAITAGLQRSRGRWTVVMDCDLQEPPEEISRLYAKAKEGYDIVLARRRSRSHSTFRRLATRAYFGLMNLFVPDRLEGEYGTFSIISRPVVESFLQLGERERHYLFILRWLGYEHTSIDFDHAERHSGKSGYTLGRLIRHAADGVFFQTTILLRWIVYLGFCLAAAGIVFGAAILYSYFVTDPLPGWTGLAMLLLVIGGFIVISTGVTGLYIGKIFTQVKGRPLYLVDEEVAGIRSEGPARTRSLR